jgi:hypothetical protein
MARQPLAKARNGSSKEKSGLASAATGRSAFSRAWTAKAILLSAATSASALATGINNGINSKAA